MKIIDQSHLLEMHLYYITYQQEHSRWGFEMHSHRQICDLTYLADGQLEQVVNGQKRSFGAGDIIWIRERDSHILRSRSMEMFNINFHQSELTKIASVIYKQAECEKLITQKTPPRMTIPVENRKKFQQLLFQLLTEHKNQKHSTLFHQFLFNTFTDYLLPLTEEENTSNLPAWLSDCVDYIDRNLQQDLSPAALSEICSKSREHIARSFKKFLNMSISQYISQRRLELASILLSNTNRDILDISYSLGFNSPSYFYRQFKQRYNMPPLAYRKEKSPLYSGEIF